MSEIQTDRPDERGGKPRKLWPAYDEAERAALEPKFLGDWESLEFMKNFWNPVVDDEDRRQWRNLAMSWRLKQHKGIQGELGFGAGRAGQYVKGYNLRPYLAQMFLTSQRLPKPRDGWSYVLSCTPKPSVPTPSAVIVPSQVQSYQDIIDFLAQFPTVPDTDESLRFLGLTSQWAVEHRLELFGFLLGFLVGDAGKSYPDYETRARHYAKTAVTTNMALTESNLRVLRYVALALSCVGIGSHRIRSEKVLRWYSESSDLVTWMLRVCLGLKEGERTSRNPVVMPWLIGCPREFKGGFLQGLAESDGHVDKNHNYCDIASIPNPEFITSLVRSLGQNAQFYKYRKICLVRIDVRSAHAIPLFNPIIHSYRFEKLETKCRKLGLPPLPSFSMNPPVDAAEYFCDSLAFR